ncbi:unnamed protein product [Cylindrotheca closterium]|uniref:Uncharacterized protein n=1 Tax=Cylindrotheca closterium TaxID=2856 RepID=A0AAD2G8S0_9STRA|nr:unnamed protein product [Cylindrotheca closterium]
MAKTKYTKTSNSHDDAPLSPSRNKQNHSSADRKATMGATKPTKTVIRVSKRRRKPKRYHIEDDAPSKTDALPHSPRQSSHQAKSAIVTPAKHKPKTTAEIAKNKTAKTTLPFVDDMAREMVTTDDECEPEEAPQDDRKPSATPKLKKDAKLNNPKRNIDDSSDTDTSDDDDGFLSFDIREPAAALAITKSKRARHNHNAGLSLAEDLVHAKEIGGDKQPFLRKHLRKIEMLHPNRVVTACVGDVPGTVVLICLLPKDTNRSPPIQVTLDKILNNESALKQFQRHCKVHMIPNMCDETNPMIPKACGRTGDYFQGKPWPLLLCIRQKRWTSQELTEWAETIARALTAVSDDQCRYLLPLAYAGDITPKIKQPLSYYITVPDVLEALKLYYFPNTDINTILAREDIGVYLDPRSLKLARDAAKRGQGNGVSYTYNEALDPNNPAYSYFHD